MRRALSQRRLDARQSLRFALAMSLDEAPDAERSTPYAPPHTDVDAAQPTSRHPDQATLGQRVAGGAFVAIGLASLTTLLPSTATKSPFSSPIAILIDIGIGISLLSGSSKTVKWAMIRVVLGTLLFGGMALAQGGGVVPAIIYASLAAGFLLLLYGDASKPRISVGGFLLGVLFLLTLVGSGVISMPSSVTRLLVARNTGITGKEITVVEGVDFRYRLPLKGGPWFARPRDLARKENALADQWAVWADLDGHLMVIGEPLAEGTTLSLDAYAAAVTKNASAGSLTLESNETITSAHAGEARVLEFRGKIDGLEIGMLNVLYATDVAGYQVLAWAPAAAFDREKATLRATATGLEPAP